MFHLIARFKSLPIQVQAGFAFLLCTVFQRSFTIITTPIFTRLLTTAEYGKYSVFVSWERIITCFVTMSISSGIYGQVVVKFDDRRPQYSSAMQGLTLTLVLLGFGVYLVASDFWNSIFSLETSQMAAMFIIMWGHAVFGFWSGEQRVEYKYKHLLLITLLVSLLQPVMCVLFIWNSSNKVTGLVWGIAVTMGLCYSYLFYIQQKRGKLFYSKSIWLYSLRLALPLIPHYLSMVALNSLDRIMIENMVGSSEAGIYNLAYTISLCGMLINQAVLQTLNPWIGYRIKYQQFHELKRIVYPVLVGIACINLLIILFVPEIVRIFAPPSYGEAIWIMPPIVMSVFFDFAYNLFGKFEFYFEKTHYLSIATFVGAVVNILLNYFFISRYGYFAAGYTTLVCYILFVVMHYYFMRRICCDMINNVKVYELSVLVAISAIFMLCGFLMMRTYTNAMLRYGLICIILLAILIKRSIISSFVATLILNRKNVK